MRKLMMVIGVMACGPASDVREDGANVDAGTAVVDATSATTDALPVPLVAIDVTCQEWFNREVKADGSRTEQANFLGLVDGLVPTSDFVVERCGLTFVFEPPAPPSSNCPAGSTCTTIGNPYGPNPVLCEVARGGNFVDGKLAVSCGNETRYYDASGVLTRRLGTRYQTVRVHR